MTSDGASSSQRPAGVVVWLTGLPSAGKTALARRIDEEVRRLGVPACVLDGDEVRETFGGALGYSAEKRAAFYEILARLGALLARQGHTVLIPATAPLRRFRDRARELAPAFLEVWVDTPLEECVRRDAKGLFRARDLGLVRDVPGADAPYEPPLAPDVVAHGGDDAPAALDIARHAARLRSDAGDGP